MKRQLMAMLCVAAILWAGCSKNDTPAFNAVGLWKGNAFVYYAILDNKSDGKGNLYLKSRSNDTANADLKLYGRYMVDKGKMTGFYLYPGSESDSLLLQTYTVSSTTITGIFISTLTGEAIPFDLRKQ